MLCLLLRSDLSVTPAGGSCCIAMLPHLTEIVSRSVRVAGRAGGRICGGFCLNAEEEIEDSATTVLFQHLHRLDLYIQGARKSVYPLSSDLHAAASVCRKSAIRLYTPTAQPCTPCDIFNDKQFPGAVIRRALLAQDVQAIYRLMFPMV